MDWLVEKSNGVADGPENSRQVTRAIFHHGQRGRRTIIVLFSRFTWPDPKTYVEARAIVPGRPYRPRLREVMRELSRGCGVWLLTKLISMAFVAVCVTRIVAHARAARALRSIGRRSF